jgi:hypothetical protein
VLNVAAGTAPRDDLQLMFLGFVDAFTPLHLRMLKFFRDPNGFANARGVKLPDFVPIMGQEQTPSYLHPFRDLWPDEGQQFPSIRDQVYSELASRSLLRWSREDTRDFWPNAIAAGQAVSAMRRGTGTSRTFISPLGKAFLAFIESPQPQSS